LFVAHDDSRGLLLAAVLLPQTFWPPVSWRKQLQVAILFFKAALEEARTAAVRRALSFARLAEKNKFTNHELAGAQWPDLIFMSRRRLISHAIESSRPSPARPNDSLPPQSRHPGGGAGQASNGQMIISCWRVRFGEAAFGLDAAKTEGGRPRDCVVGRPANENGDEREKAKEVFGHVNGTAEINTHDSAAALVVGIPSGCSVSR
jgi:hypothetical protein